MAHPLGLEVTLMYTWLIKLSLSTAMRRAEYHTKKLKRLAPKNALLSTSYLLLAATVLLLLIVFNDNFTLRNQLHTNELAAVRLYPAAPNSSASDPTAVVNGKPLTTPPALQSTDHVLGDRNANLLLIEYSDFECPFCKIFHATLRQAVQDYHGQVAWVLRNMPLSFHQNAPQEAEAAECVASLGGNDAYWKYADAIFQRTTSNGTGFNLENLSPLAAEVGVDRAAFDQCLTANTFQKRITSQSSDGTTMGILGTPGTILLRKDGTTRLLAGALPYTNVKATIDQLLK